MVRSTAAALASCALLLASCGKTPIASLFPDDDARVPESARDGSTPDRRVTKDGTPAAGDGEAFIDIGARSTDAGPSFDVGCTTCADATEPADSGGPGSNDSAMGDPDAATSPDAGSTFDGGSVPDAGAPADAGAPGCSTDRDCSFGGFFGHCEPTSHTCVQCLSDPQCGPGRICDTQNGFVCRVPCFNGQCGPLGVCDPATNACVECLSNADCSPEVCDPTTKSCVACVTNTDCTLQVARPVCDPNDHACVECNTGADCSGGEQCLRENSESFCAVPTGRGLCEPCDSDSDCGGPNDLCVGRVSTGGVFDRACGIDCAQSSSVCPSGFECTSIRQGSAMQCRPSYAMQTPTCEATRHLGAACPLQAGLDPGCGISGVQDARCVQAPSSTAGVCTVWCQDNSDCKAGFTCIGATQSQVGNCL